ncbi:hypothetical protein MPER_02558 [Moniliophthora perniciosa FA553]|nr:hypothetical protein MPER_02558 [Moniliophthora perniciosa FA553]
MYKLFTLAALASVVVAAPGHGGQGGAKQCNTGSIQCCNTVDNASNEDVAKELGLVGLVIQDLNIPIGIQCNPIDIIGIGGNSCTRTTRLLREEQLQ